jgi:hypothetical protein
MAGWSQQELESMATEDELELATQRRDGSLRDPVTIWMVRLGDDVFIRSVKGPDGPWFRGSRTLGRGIARTDGVEREIAFEDADHALDDEIDAVYRSKYSRYATGIVDSVLTADARASTTRLIPS